MTTTTEWSQVESSMQDIAPSSDLFDGDILGDELMDIYNAAVVGGGEDDVNMNGKHMSWDECIQKIPLCLM